jgi:hypothetical protein
MGRRFYQRCQGIGSSQPRVAELWLSTVTCPIGPNAIRSPLAVGGGDKALDKALVCVLDAVAAAGLERVARNVQGLEPPSEPRRREASETA